MVDVGAAVHAAADGIALDVEVVPGAATSTFPAGFNPWRKRVEARVTAPPEKGEANAELAEIVARYFGVAARAVAVTSGHTSRRKTLRVAGVTREAAIARLAGDVHA